jgi:cobalt-zinc-cadmium efflux system protein
MAHDAHDHHEEQGHHHAHAPASFGAAFGIGIALNAGFVVLEAVFGLVGHSMALLADAGHNFSDVLTLGVAWLAAILGRRAATPRFTYGLGGGTILAALFNAVVLLLVTGGLGWEALRRFVAPQPVAGGTMMAVAACGIFINGVSAWLLSRGSKGDLNVRGAFLHMAADALVSLGVVIAGGVIVLTGWSWVDPLTSLAVNAVIIWGTWGLLTSALAMAMNAVPASVDLPAIRQMLSALPGVTGVHDLHVWALSTTVTALTCHVTRPGEASADELLETVRERLHEEFGISHITLQVEGVEPSAAHMAGLHE